MSLARRILISVLSAVALIATASAAGEATASAATPRYITGYGWGSGTSAAAAKMAAKDDMIGDYGPCQLQTLAVIYDTGSGTSWNAEVEAECTAPR
jgi:hypothetical protein